jgi:tetratricopeptide (TPR) repeat protein
MPPLTPRQIKERTFGVLLDQLRRLCAKQPVLVVFEDLHWIDPTSLELLTHLVEQAARLPFLLVATARPELTPPWPNHSHISLVALTRLCRPDVESLIGSVLRGKALPPEVLAQIVARTDGVPLFIEELTKTLLESGIMRDAGGRYELTGPLPSRSIPSTLHASLLARLDRLGSVKDIAQVGAAIGGEFAYGLIAAVSALPEQDLKAGLAQLVGAELIFQRGVPPDASYRFKHALVQDAAYDSLLRSRRQQLHRQIARVLEEQFPNIAATAPETLAHHFTEAALTEPAIEYWGRAGERALCRSANAEAVKHLKKGIELTHSLPVSAERHRRELALQMPLGPATMALKGAAAPETVQVFSRARELLTEDATLAEQMNVLMGLWLSHGVSGHLTAAREVAQQCLSLATRHEHAGAEARANRYMGSTRLMMGELVEARRHLKRTLELCDAHQAIVLHFLDDNRVHALSFLSWTHWLLGYPDQAVTAVSSALAAAKEVGHAVTTAMALIAEAKLGTIGGDPERAAASAESALAVCIEHGLADWENWSRYFQGELLARRGDPQQGIVVMHNALAGLDRIGAKQSRALHLGGLAAAHISLREFDVGLRLLDQAIQIADKTEERVSEAELHRLRGEVLMTTGRRDEAQVELEQALAIARRQDARFWELRTATTLARLWRDAYCREARDLLSPVCEWFGEGLELPDLKVARALLDELGRA